MGKPGKPDDPHDATQPLSESQVVAVTSNPPASAPPIAPNDQSIAWKGTVVSADEFAPRKPRPMRAKWIVIGVLAAAAVGGVAVVLVPRGGVAPATVAPVDSSAAAIILDAAAVPAVIPADAAEPPPPDAALPADAAVPAAVPPVKHTKKKKPRPRGH
ncbi:MAG TPA: hypothetical protein VGG74_24315 [Kofleriaceae bacterium]|jgi:hypothetical protein